MIPLELRLTNFLSYRQQAVVDLRAVHLACISGANGAGKSTLLDAMTWALFGRSRARSDDDLVHRAAKDGAGAEVELVFDMEGVLYRVLRRKRPQKQAELELQIGTVSDNGMDWHSLTEGRIRETQAAIERLLRMNYDVFTNASFFLQGKADEFTNRTPGKRKEILAEVLGVTQWDAYRETVADQRKATQNDLELLQRRLEEVSAELAEAEERQRGLDEALGQESAIAERLKDKEQVWQQARQLQALVDQQQQQVEHQARQLAELRADRAALEQRIASRRSELARLQELVADEERIEADFAAWSDAEARFQQWQTLAEKVRELEQEQNPLNVRIAEARSRLTQRLEGLEAQQDAVTNGLEEKASLEESLAEWRSELAELGTESDKLAEHAEELRQLELELQQLEAERQQREQELRRLKTDYERIEAGRQERHSVEVNLQAAQSRLAELSTDLAALSKQAEQTAAMTAQRDQLQAEQKRLEAEANREKERLAQLTADVGAMCPLCGQPLSEQHRADVTQELERELDQKREAYRQNRADVESINKQLAELSGGLDRRAQVERELESQQQRKSAAEARLQSLEEALSRWGVEGNEAKLAELTAWASKPSLLEGKRERVTLLRNASSRKAETDQALRELDQQIAKAEERLEAVKRLELDWQTRGSKDLAETAAQLTSETFASQERRLLAEIQERLQAIGYDREQHQAAQEQRQTLRTAPEEHQALRQAQAAIKPLKEALDESEHQQADLTARQTEQDAQYQSLLTQLQTLRESAVDPTALELEVIRLREALSIASQTVGAARQKVAVLEDRRRQETELTRQRKQRELRVQRMRLLEEACGRNGVQALLIENALPEIEERANELLDRLSGGEMRVTFETQRELKSRDAVAETLDIHISDSTGERPYENYSGGEQFRVNFAVRLALSQVLAQRAGARLRTLVIDEGFGSQDPQGRQRLVEAINAVQSDFDCVLVITHIDELRDAFPARIEVTKTETGSHANVIAGV